jgi:TPR repeat protein
MPPKTDAPDRVPSAENATAGAETTRPLPKQPRRATANKPAAAAETAALSEKSSPSEASAGAGAEELAVAQGYLGGTNGQSRNSAEGAKWLWKAVAKHNAQATFLLSDLYLRGDGVSKNCDQAHVLLDAATLKGVKGAGERLRHLQAFGCQ